MSRKKPSKAQQPKIFMGPRAKAKVEPGLGSVRRLEIEERVRARVRRMEER